MDTPAKEVEDCRILEKSNMEKLEGKNMKQSTLFGNVGKAIKVSAILNFAVGVIGSVIIGFWMINAGNSTYRENYYGICGIAIMTIVPLLFWCASSVIYGFGELVENSDIQKRTTMEIRNMLRELSR